MSTDFYYPPSKNAIQKTLSAQLLNTATTGDAISLSDVDGIQNKKGVLVINRVDSNNAATPSAREYISFSGTSGSTVLIETRNVDNSASAKTHPVGSIVEFIPDAVWAQRLIDQFTVEHDVDGTHNVAAIVSAVSPGTSGNVLTSNGTSWESSTPAASSSFWNTVPGTPIRVSDTQFTITDTSNANLYDLLFKKGVILKWLESTTFQTAMVISSSYGTNTVTVNIVGDSLTAGFTSMKYAITKASKEVFIIPGTLPSAATTNISKTWFPEENVYIISADLNLGTAGGSTGSTVVDINDDGTTKFTTKPTITTTGTSDLDNVADNPSTAVVAQSAITVDVDSVTATAPVDGYVSVYYYPVSLQYRT